MNGLNVPRSRVIGSILMIAGCCIGAGMLGLPVLTALGGFRPTIGLFFISWLFMVTTGLLVLEVNLWFKEDVNIVTMASRTLGSAGKWLSWLLFVFLFYSVMVAYASACGQLTADFASSLFGLPLPEWAGSIFLSALFGIFLYLGTRVVDQFNRLLMLCLMAAYFVLVSMGVGHINFEYLQHSNWGSALVAVPAMIISFGFHNLIPSLSTYLSHDVKKLRLSIIIGSLIPLAIYLVWEALILGLIPIHGVREALDQGEMATRSLRNAVGASWIVDMAESFAFFAIVTSFLTVALSFVDFLADGLHIKKNRLGTIFLCLLTLVPPVAFSLFYPKIFLRALSYAGAFGAVILFGILPALMVWSGRYHKKMEGPVLVPGGKYTLGAVMVFAVIVVILELTVIA